MAPHLLGGLNIKPLSLWEQFCVWHVRPKDATRNNHLKRLPEPTVEEGVHQRVDGGIQIPQPDESVEQDGRYRVADEGVDDITDEKWRPEGQKHAHDDGQCFGGFPLVLVHLGGAGVLKACGAYLSLGHQVDLQVDAQHDDPGDVEGDNGRDSDGNPTL